MMQFNVIKKSAQLVFSLVLIYSFTNITLASDAQLWQQFSNAKAVAIMRHAIAPGGGDPNNFVINDCSTQRNLSTIGHQQAKDIGKIFRTHGVSRAAVYSSQWCRCLDTASGLNFDKPTPLPIVNSFFQDRSTASQQTTQLTNWVKERLVHRDKKPAIIVTHQVNITALTGVFPTSGEIVFVGFEEDTLVVLGSVLPP